MVLCIAYRPPYLSVSYNINLEPWSIAEYFVILTVAINIPCVHSYTDTSTGMSVEEVKGGLSFISHDTEEFNYEYSSCRKEKSKRKIIKM
jgi:hypothetical protein